jgi:hypothetical protein
VNGVAALAGHEIAAHQVNGDGKARHWQLFESPVVEVLAQHRVELPAAELIDEV